MQIHFLRNATLIIRSGAQHVLVDPMLGTPCSLPPYAFWRHRAARNPLRPLPESAAAALPEVTAALITHCRFGHFDHLDPAGWRFLARQGVPVWAQAGDVGYLGRRGVAAAGVRAGEVRPFLNGSLLAIPTQHGTGLIGRLMGPGLGYLLRLPGEPSLYLSGDTVLTPAVRRVLAEERPDVVVLAAGSASLDVGAPILMPLPELLEAARLAPGRVIATHMEALNHCPTTRAQLRRAAADAGLLHKVTIPADGDVVRI